MSARQIPRSRQIWPPVSLAAGLQDRPVGHRTTIVTQQIYRHQLEPVISAGATAMNTIFRIRNRLADP